MLQLALVFVSLSLINFTMFLVARNVISKALWPLYDSICEMMPRYKYLVWQNYVEMVREKKGGTGKL